MNQLRSASFAVRLGRIPVTDRSRILPLARPLICIRHNAGQNKGPSMLNYGWWWHERAGMFRRIRGQGLEPKKRFDHLEFLENPDNRRDHPHLYRWITKRKRDQEWERVRNCTFFNGFTVKEKFRHPTERETDGFHSFQIFYFI